MGVARETKFILTTSGAAIDFQLKAAGSSQFNLRRRRRFPAQGSYLSSRPDRIVSGTIASSRWSSTSSPLPTDPEQPRSPEAGEMSAKEPPLLLAGGCRSRRAFSPMAPSICFSPIGSRAKFSREDADARLFITFLRMFVVQRYTAQFQKLCQPGIRVLVLTAVLIALAVLSFQGSTLAPGKGSPPLFPMFEKGSLSSDDSSASKALGEAIPPNDSKNHAPPIQEEQNRWPPVAGAVDEHHNEMDETDGDPDDFDLDGEESQERDEFLIDLGHGVRIKKVKDPHGGYMTLEKSVDAGNDSSVGMDEASAIGSKSASSKDSRTNSSLAWDKTRNLDDSSLVPSVVSYPAGVFIDKGVQEKQGNKSGDVANMSSLGERKRQTNQALNRSEQKPLQSGVTIQNQASISGEETTSK